MDYPTKQQIQELIEKKAKKIHAEISAKVKADGRTEELKISDIECIACEQVISHELCVLAGMCP
jgi:hypothetical protein